MRYLGFFCFIILINIELKGQPSQSNSAVDIRTIIPPSPNAASLLKFVDVPVSKFTGLPETTIPIYTVEDKSIHLPISLQYHSGGVKVAESASWVGNCWALSFGGVVSQSIRGNQDDGLYRSRFNGPGIDKVNPTICDLWKACSGDIDPEPDLYSFSINGMSGGFVLDDNKNVVQIPEQKIKIEPLMGDGYQSSMPFIIPSWKITDQNGISYFFEVREQQISGLRTGAGNLLPWPAVSQQSWYISKIVDPQGNTVTFEYDDFNSLDYFPSSENRRFLYSNSTGTNHGEATGTSIFCFQNISSGKRIRKINFDGGRIEFVAGGNRCDLSGDKWLQKIDVYNKNNQLLKETVLNYKYYVGKNIYDLSAIDCSGDNGPYVESTSSSYHNNYKDRRLFLTSIDEKDGQLNKISSYGFEYENSIGLPNRFSKEQDYWGYYNGNGYASLLQNIHKNEDGSYDILGREASLFHAKQGILNKIIYPTGGYTQFDFELNTVPAANNAIKVVHPQQVYNADGTARDVQLGYFSINDISGNKQITFQVQRCVFGPTGTPAAGFYIKDINDNVVVSGSQVTSFNQQTSNGPFNITLSNGTYKIYSYAITSVPCTYNITMSEWIELQPSGNEATCGGVRVKRITSFDPVQNKTLIDSYDYSMVRNGEKVSSGELFVQQDLQPNNYISYEPSDFPPPIEVTMCPSENVDYAVNVISNTNYPLGTTSNGAMGYSQVTVKHLDDRGNDQGYSDYQYLNAKNDETMGYSTSVGGIGGGIYGNIPAQFTTHSLAPAISFAWSRGKLKSEYHFANVGDNTYKPVRKTDYFYNSNDLHLSSVAGGLGVRYLVRGTVGCGANDCGGPFRDGNDYYSYTPYQVKTGYMFLDSVRTEDIDKASNVIKSTTSYSYNASNFLPSTITTTNSRQEVSISNIKYPIDYSISGTPLNPVALGIQNLQNHFMINIPVEKFQQISELDGSNLRTIGSVFTTFKTDAPLPETVYITQNNDVMTDFSPAILSSSTTIMDRRYIPKVIFNKYDPSGNLQEQYKNGDVHEIYLWGYGNQYPVAKIVGSKYDDVIALVSQSTLNNISISDVDMRTELQKLRNGLPKAMVTTYTYQPLVGVTSETDPLGRTVYYYYDAFGRLDYIKDKDGNVVKKFEYHYKN